MPELKLYTVAELREWLVNNKPAEGLSEQVIAPTRAWAIIHNPYVKDDDAIVAAIFEDGQLAAYTASFPDMLDGKRVWWASTLYCYPQFVGRGYGMIVVGSLKEAHEPEWTLDRCMAQDTIEIFKHLDSHAIYTPRYFFSEKTTFKPTLRGKVSYIRQCIKKYIHPWPKMTEGKYTLRYNTYVDGEAYAFMQVHRRNDLWLREQEMLNWILRFPFKQGCVLMEHVQNDTRFTANVLSYGYIVAKVYVAASLIGVYILRTNEDLMSVAYVYYDDEKKDVLFSSIVDHCIRIRPKSLITDCEELAEYIREKLYFPEIKQGDVSFSMPNECSYNVNSSLQLGDGDGFV